MDLDTENRIAAILLKEAAELRREAQKEGALAYLRQPTVRSRPNSRFLTATVRGVQQANRVVEVNEMWRLREKQLELDNRHRGGKNESSSGRGYKDVCESRRNTSIGSNLVETSASASSLLSRKRFANDLDPMEDEGLRDEEVDEFLHSRTKRGRGAVGSRMDEAGPYLPSSPNSRRNVLESNDEEPKRARVLLGPDKTSFFSSSESSDDEFHRARKKKAKVGSSKQHTKKHRSKEKSKDKKKKKSKEKKSRHKK